MNSKLVDTHAHLCDAAFDNDRSGVLERAFKSGIKTVISVGEDLADAEKNLELSKVHPMIKPAAGLYPEHVDLGLADEMRGFIRNNKDMLVAIGEVGLDFWVVKEDAQKDIQREIFKRFIQLSCELNLPLNVHSRSAGRHAVDMLLENSAKKVQLHAFDGKASAALPAVEAGYFFSIPPSVTRSRQKQKLVKQLPLANILVETDSPVLGPDPQKRNEPANLLFSIKTIAEIKNLAANEVIEAVVENTSRLYRTIDQA